MVKRIYDRSYIESISGDEKFIHSLIELSVPMLTVHLQNIAEASERRDAAALLREMNHLREIGNVFNAKSIVAPIDKIDYILMRYELDYMLIENYVARVVKQTEKLLAQLKEDFIDAG